MTHFDCFMRQCRRHWLIQRRQPALLINTSLFFLMITMFFPLSLPFNPKLLQTFAPGILWMSVLLAVLLASERLFQQDYDDGVLDQWLLSDQSFALLVSAKLLVHWVLILLPLLFFCPLLALMFGFSWSVTGVFLMALILGTLCIQGLCALASAFNTGQMPKGVLMALIVLPLTVPVMIFGSLAVTAAMQGMPVSAYLALLLAMALLVLSFIPLTIAAVLRIGLTV